MPANKLQVEIEAREALRHSLQFGLAYPLIESTLRFEHWTVDDKQYVQLLDKHGPLVMLRVIPSDGPAPFALAGGWIPFPAGSNVNMIDMIRDAKYKGSEVMDAAKARRAELL